MLDDRIELSTKHYKGLVLAIELIQHVMVTCAGIVSIYVLDISQML